MCAPRDPRSWSIWQWLISHARRHREIRKLQSTTPALQRENEFVKLTISALSYVIWKLMTSSYTYSIPLNPNVTFSKRPISIKFFNFFLIFFKEIHLKAFLHPQIHRFKANKCIFWDVKIAFVSHAKYFIFSNAKRISFVRFFDWKIVFVVLFFFFLLIITQLIEGRGTF